MKFSFANSIENGNYVAKVTSFRINVQCPHCANAQTLTPERKCNYCGNEIDSNLHRIYNITLGIKNESLVTSLFTKSNYRDGEFMENAETHITEDSEVPKKTLIALTAISKNLGLNDIDDEIIAASIQNGIHPVVNVQVRNGDVTRYTQVASKGKIEMDDLTKKNSIEDIEDLPFD